MDYVDSHDSGYGGDDSTASSLHPDRFDHEHVSKLEEFSQDLQKAIANSFPRPSTSYTAVHVLLLRWADDDLNVQVELSSLKAVLENQYLFAAEQWDIPSLNSTRALQTKLYDFQNSHQSEDELLIVYYGGHADADRRRGRSIWAANRKPDSPTLTWSSLQHLLENAIPHVFIILDCCYAANAARDTSEGTTKEIIAACGRENPTLGVGERSFTSALIEELQAFGSQPFTVTMLHSRLITMRWRLAFTPVYALLSEHGGHSIELTPQSAPARATSFLDEANPEMDEDMMDISAPEAHIASDTRVLLSVSISDDATCDIAEWKEWLTHKAPRAVTQIGVKVEAVFKSHSTMLMTSLPTVAWDCLPDKAAYRFIGFIKSGNLDRTHPGSEEQCQRLAATVSEQQRHLFEVEKQMQFLESEVMSTLEKMVKDRAATDVDELYNLRLQANQQLKALELMKKPRSIGGVEVGDSSTQGQPEDPLPETRSQRLSAVQGELNAEGSGIRTPDSSSDSLEQSTLGVIETKKQPANYAISSIFEDGPFTQYTIQKHISDTRVKSREHDLIPKSKPEVMTGHGNAMSSTIDFSSKGMQGSTASSSQPSFDASAIPDPDEANQSQKTVDRTLGPGSLEPASTATTSYVGTEQATLPSKRKRSHRENDLSSLNIPRFSVESRRKVSTAGFSCPRCFSYQADRIPLIEGYRASLVDELWCKDCNNMVLQNLIIEENVIQSIIIPQCWQQQPQETSSNHTRTMTTQNNEEKKDTQPLLAQTLPLTFLVAVHDKDIRRLLLSKLSTLGYADVYQASDGKEAVQKVARSHFTRGHGEKPINVVFMDPLLPIMDGYEATRNILALDRRERRGQFTSSNKPEDNYAAQTKPGVTVLAVSAATSDAARKRAMAVGIRGYIIPTVIEHLDMVLLKYCTGHQIREGQENDLEPYASDTGFFDNEFLYNFQRRWDSAIEPPPFGIGIRESDKSLKYSKGHLKATTTNVIPARPVTHAALAALREQETARGPSTLWGGTPAVSRLGQGPVLLDDWNESKLEELATAYMRSRENMWRILASKLGREWSTVEEKCFEKGVEELSKLSRKAQSRTHAFFHGDAESSFSNDKRTIASYTDSAIGMD